jgi:hypothetical protein
VWKRRIRILYTHRLCGSSVSWVRIIGASVLDSSRPMAFNKCREMSSIAYLANQLELDRASSHFFEYSNQPRGYRMGDLGLQPREVWNQPGRLPAEGRPGSSENTRSCLFLLPARPSLQVCHLFGIRSLVTWLSLQEKSENYYIRLFPLQLAQVYHYFYCHYYNYFCHYLYSEWGFK